MKKYHILILIGVFLFSMGSCKKDKQVVPDPIDKVEEPVEEEEKSITPSKPDYVLVTTEYDGGKVHFNWLEIDKSRVETINMSYEKEGETKLIEVTDFTEPSYVLDDMEVGHQYDFTITATGQNDEVSEAYNVSVTPKPFAAHEVVNFLENVSSNGLTATVKWINNTKKSVKVHVSVNGSPAYESQLSSTKNGEFSISELIIPSPLTSELEYEFEVTVVDEYGTVSSAKKNTVMLQAKVANPTDWGLTVSSNQSGEGAIANLIDGKLDTYWHSQWSAPVSTYPHWIVIDMKKSEIVSQVDLAPRHNSANGFRLFNIEGSMDGVNWVRVLDNQILNLTLKDYQGYSFQVLPPLTSQKFRYIRINALEGSESSTNLAEIRIHTFQK